MEEEWRTIPSHPLYLASSKGRIRRVGRKLIRKAQKHKKTGYLYLNLQDKPWTDTRCAVHRLVCEAFHGKPDSKMDVNHKNGVKDDNRPENLEWCSRSENLLHKIHVLKRNPGGLRRRPVVCVETGEYFPNTYAAICAGHGHVWESATYGGSCKGKHWKFYTNREGK